MSLFNISNCISCVILLTFFKYNDAPSTFLSPNSFVKYDETIINDLNKRVDNYLLIIIVLGVETLILLMVLILNMIRKSRRKKKVKKIMLDKMNEKDKKVNNKEESEENIDNEENK